MEEQNHDPEQRSHKTAKSPAGDSSSGSSDHQLFAQSCATMCAAVRARSKMDGEKDQSRPESLRHEILQRLYDRLSSILEKQPVDVKELQFACHHYLVLLHALGDIVDVDEDILSAISDLNTVIQQEKGNQTAFITVHLGRSSRGRPRLAVSRETLEHLVEMGLPTSFIAKLCGVSKSTLFRRMSENNISVSATYSKCSDEELDSLITAIKSTMPDAGYRVVRGALLAQGHRVQWERLYASMNRVDSGGVLARMTHLECASRRLYTAPFPKYMMHIETNHKLIRYNFNIFGGIDGYSRKIMYLKVAGNNRADTHLAFFNEAVNEHGFPHRVRSDHGGENVGIAELMLSVRGTDTNSFITGKSLHNQWIERFWHDVFMNITSLYCNILHSLEDQDLLEISNILHLFCCHYVFLPRIQASLEVFREAWDNHPIRTKQNMTPNQLWQLGLAQNPVPNPEIKREESGYMTEPHPGIKVPVLDGPLSDSEMLELQDKINPLQHSDCLGIDLYLHAVQYVENLTKAT